MTTISGMEEITVDGLLTKVVAYQKRAEGRISDLEAALLRIRAIAASPHELRDNVAAIDYCAAEALGHLGKRR